MVVLALTLDLRLALEHAAEANGFDVKRKSAPNNWLAYRSSQVPLKIWLAGGPGEIYLVAFSHAGVAQALGGTAAAAGPGSAYGVKAASPRPPGAVALRTATGIPELHKLLRRAYKLSATLPDELLRTFEKKIKGRPRTTEAERLVVMRVGQDVFRQGLLDYWHGRCALTGLDVPELLRASHIKPWADCESDAERLDIHNGLLLAAHIDAAFDSGLISFENAGALLLSPTLDATVVSVLGLKDPLPPIQLSVAHYHYLDWHRERVFRSH